VNDVIIEHTHKAYQFQMGRARFIQNISIVSESIQI